MNTCQWIGNKLTTQNKFLIVYIFGIITRKFSQNIISTIMITLVTALCTGTLLIISVIVKHYLIEQHVVSVTLKSFFFLLDKNRIENHTERNLKIITYSAFSEKLKVTIL